LVFLWASSLWKPSRRITQTYTASGTLTSTWLQETWSGTAFVNDSRKFYRYDPNGLITDWHTESFLGGLWVVTGGDGNHRYHYVDATGVPGENTLRNRLLVLPNPASSVLTVILPLEPARAADLRVLDMTGRQVMQVTIPAGAGAAELSTIHLADGVYLLQAAAGMQRWQEQFTVYH
jgi:hypothetical protein